MKIRFAVAAGAGEVGVVPSRGEGNGIPRFRHRVAVGPSARAAASTRSSACPSRPAATIVLKLGANVVPHRPQPAHPGQVAGPDRPAVRRPPAAQLRRRASTSRASGWRSGADGVNRGDRLEELTPAAAGVVGRRRGQPSTAAGTHSRTWRRRRRSFQQPLEVWFGGSGPAALARTGRARGWLAGLVHDAVRGRKRPAGASSRRPPTPAGPSTPSTSGSASRTRRSAPDARTLQLLKARRPDADAAALVPVGPDDLRRLLAAHVDAGVTKFVVRPVGSRSRRCGDARGPGRPSCCPCRPEPDLVLACRRGASVTSSSLLRRPLEDNLR